MNNSLKYTVLVGILAISTTSHAMEKEKPSLALRAATVIADHTPLNIITAASLGAVAYTASNALARRIGGGSWKTSLIHLSAQWAAGQLWDQINRRPLYEKNRSITDGREKRKHYQTSFIRRAGPAIQATTAVLTSGLISKKWNAQSFIVPAITTACFIPLIKGLNIRILIHCLTTESSIVVAKKIGGKAWGPRAFRIANYINALIPGYRNLWCSKCPYAECHNGQPEQYLHEDELENYVNNASNGEAQGY